MCHITVFNRYSSFVRIGSGLTYADYIWIREKPWKPFDKNNLPSWYQVSKKGTEDKGDVYLEPEECVVPHHVIFKGIDDSSAHSL